MQRNDSFNHIYIYIFWKKIFVIPVKEIPSVLLVTLFLFLNLHIVFTNVSVLRLILRAQVGYLNVWIKHNN